MNLIIKHISCFIFLFFITVKAVIAASYPIITSLNIIPNNNNGNEDVLRVKTRGFNSGYIGWGNKGGDDTVDICAGCKPTLMIRLGGMFFSTESLMDATLSASTTYLELNDMMNYSGVREYKIDLQPYIRIYENTVGWIPDAGIPICAFIAWSTTQNSQSQSAPYTYHAFPVGNSTGCDGASGGSGSGSGSLIIHGANCKFDSSVEVNFGTLTSEEIENKSRIVQVVSECRVKTDAIISLANGGDSITLSNGLIASLTFDNKSMGSDMTLNKGTFTHNLTVWLSGSTSQLGEFSGSGTLNFDVQ